MLNFITMILLLIASSIKADTREYGWAVMFFGMFLLFLKKTEV